MRINIWLYQKNKIFKLGCRRCFTNNKKGVKSNKKLILVFKRHVTFGGEINFRYKCHVTLGGEIYFRCKCNVTFRGEIYFRYKCHVTFRSETYFKCKYQVTLGGEIYFRCKCQVTLGHHKQELLGGAKLPLRTVFYCTERELQASQEKRLGNRFLLLRSTPQRNIKSNFMGQTYGHLSLPKCYAIFWEVQSWSFAHLSCC